MTMRERVRIGQRWERRRDHHEATIAQIWRPDRQVLMRSDAGREIVGFAELRRYWREIA